MVTSYDNKSIKQFKKEKNLLIMDSKYFNIM